MNTIQQAHILLVDDNTDLLRLLEEQLRGAGYQNIRTVQNCAAAQTAFAAEMPELMILDINLPDGDGFSLFRTLRAKADVPTLFLSARDADADRLFGLGLGAAVLLCLHQPLGHWLAVLPLPQCRFHQLTGFLCPACGNTRAVLALLQGHPLRSIGYNPMIFTLFAALTCLYAELVCTAVGKPRRILPRSNALLFLTVGIVLGYDIVRNFFPAITLCK